MMNCGANQATLHCGLCRFVLLAFDLFWCANDRYTSQLHRGIPLRFETRDAPVVLTQFAG